MMNSTKYKNEYKKNHYVRKEIIFKKEEYEIVKKFIEKNNITLKEIIFSVINKNQT